MESDLEKKRLARFGKKKMIKLDEERKRHAEKANKKRTPANPLAYTATKAITSDERKEDHAFRVKNFAKHEDEQNTLKEFVFKQARDATGGVYLDKIRPHRMRFLEHRLFDPTDPLGKITKYDEF